MKIDLHVHCRERSTCGWATEEEQIQAAQRAGLDALAFTDHDRLVPAERLAELRRKFTPFWIISGVEVTLIEEEHVLVFGVQDTRLEEGNWKYLELWQFVRQQGGFLAISHPFRYHPRIDVDLEHYPPDALELYSYNTPRAAEEQIRALAVRLGIGLLSNSDAHTAERIGQYYNQLDKAANDDAELLRQLRSANGSLQLYKPW